MSDEALELAERRIKKLYTDLSITTAERGQYEFLVRQINTAIPATTWSLAKQTKATCTELRKHLRRMEKKGLVFSDSNGTNNILWRLAP